MGELLEQNFRENYKLVGPFYHLIRMILLHRKHINKLISWITQTLENMQEVQGSVLGFLGCNLFFLKFIKSKV